jgi:hypothetical protein
MELSEQAKEAKRQYHRDWQKRNPEKVKQHQVNFWEKKAKIQLPVTLPPSDKI